MLLIEVGSARALIEAVVTGVSILGGFMAAFSGRAASKAMSEDEAPDILSQRINEAIGSGFLWGIPAAIFCLIIYLWT
jgi:hypothetical protein